MTRAKLSAAVAILLATVAALLLLNLLVNRHLPVNREAPATREQSRSVELLSELSGAQLAPLPEARYDSVITGLLPALGTAEADSAYRLRKDTALYTADRVTPVARLAARNFLGEPTVVVPVESSGDWVRVLTPALQRLPSGGADASGAPAPAQSSAWIRADALSSPTTVTARIVVSVSARTLSIVGSRPSGGARTWRVGIGAPGTPTPTGVTGYLQARYRDAAQGQAEHPVQLTSLHSQTADEPFAGSDGGLIGIHFQASSSGAVSHGCIRVQADVLAAVDALPLGTLITIEE
jgi:lipoprotein-anchoring transpeptidase ErfK/SrfK